jgi:hypothetical protein
MKPQVMHQPDPRASRAGPLRLVGLALAASLALGGCATDSPAYHRIVMQGQVLSMDGNTLTVCVGDEEGARVGQVLDVVRHVPRTGAPKATGPSYRREPVGSARIDTLFDGHYATAVVVSGQPRINDTVEFERR